MVIGHQDLQQRFQKLITSGRLGQSYLFFGEPQVGKFHFAAHCANFLETGAFEIGIRPLQDSMLIRNASGIDMIRELKTFLWQRPAIALRRTAIIDQAGSLTTEAQNALLKIVEEPPEHACVILIAEQPESLIPPLASRVQKIYFGRVSDTEMKQCSADQKAITHAFGRPGRLRQLQERNDVWVEAERWADEFLKGNHSAFAKNISERIKDMPALLDLFFETVLVHLHRDPIANYQLMQSLLHRLFLIKSYNTNKRLQLAAVRIS